LQTDRWNEGEQQDRQGDCHEPPLQKGSTETNALDDTPNWENCTLSGHSTTTCRCVRPRAAPPMLPTRSTTERTVADSSCRALQAATKGTKEARHMLLPKTTLQWPESQHEQAMTRPTVATEGASHQQAQATECGRAQWAVQTLRSGAKTSTHMGSTTAQQTRPAAATRTSSIPALQHLQLAATAVAAPRCCCQLLVGPQLTRQLQARIVAVPVTVCCFCCCF
jgi:hypothetical protein